ncbi:UDP-glycosyltransferase 74e2 [Phtheirospermum japonicum]|uniref:Glycosyltransferase n=1 Tax=Phtheirospermum japonicum TaxID=374723 RepID=A0A830BCA1_9LAMI|nr:UDP-glycosyltransferase 74e2 [Phtheirospermum japonicum]
MENAKPEQQKPHCLILPFPLQGHINPMLQFSKRLKHKGVTRVTIAVTRFFLKNAEHFPAASFPVETISDGFDDGGADKVGPEEYYHRCWETGSGTLAQLLEKLRSSGSNVDCLIYDPFFPWALDVAKKFGLMAAMFFTQSNSVNNIYFHAYKGDLKVPLSEAEIRVPGGLPVLRPADMPSFIGEYESDPERSEMMIKQFRNVDKVDWVFVNTFYELEQEVTEWMAKFLPVRTIGPTIPSSYLDKRLPDDKSYDLSVFKPVTEPCIKWLNKKPKRSVIYVSFGSFAQPRADQMEELALALKTTKMGFLWVVRASEEPKLPKNYRDEISDENGLIVTWCHQLDVLAHDAIGCFVTHCGWNSTLEALSSGVPMVALPQWSDQSTNAKFVGDVWGMGIRANLDETGIVRREEITRCVEYVMDGETGEEIRTSAVKWKRLAREAVDEGGSSNRNIEEFVSALVRL